MHFDQSVQQAEHVHKAQSYLFYLLFLNDRLKNWWCYVTHVAYLLRVFPVRPFQSRSRDKGCGVLYKLLTNLTNVRFCAV